MMSDESDFLSALEQVAARLSVPGLTQSSWSGVSIQSGSGWIDAEERRRREAVARATQKPSRAASLQGAIRAIHAAAITTNNASSESRLATNYSSSESRFAQIRLLASEADRLVNDDSIPLEPEDARDALDWRRCADEAYTDGIVARKCGLGPADHGMTLGNQRSDALAQAFALGWAVADEMAMLDDVVEAARLVLRFNDNDSRDALRAALERARRTP